MLAAVAWYVIAFLEYVCAVVAEALQNGAPARQKLRFAIVDDTIYSITFDGGARAGT